jgi:hypothetical protein
LDGTCVAETATDFEEKSGWLVSDALPIETRRAAQNETGGIGINDDSLPHAVADSFGKHWATIQDVCVMSRGAKDDTPLPTRIEVRQ